MTVVISKTEKKNEKAKAFHQRTWKGSPQIFGFSHNYQLKMAPKGPWKCLPWPLHFGICPNNYSNCVFVDTWNTFVWTRKKYLFLHFHQPFHSLLPFPLPSHLLQLLQRPRPPPPRRYVNVDSKSCDTLQSPLRLGMSPRTRAHDPTNVQISVSNVIHG